MHVTRCIPARLKNSASKEETHQATVAGVGKNQITGNGALLELELSGSEPCIQESIALY
jgi:hypothetical protein